MSSSRKFNGRAERDIRSHTLRYLGQCARLTEDQREAAKSKVSHIVNKLPEIRSAYEDTECGGLIEAIGTTALTACFQTLTDGGMRYEAIVRGPWVEDFINWSRRDKSLATESHSKLFDHIYMWLNADDQGHHGSSVLLG